MSYQNNNGCGCIAQILVIPFLFLCGLIVDTCNHTEWYMMKEARDGHSINKYVWYIQEHPTGSHIEEAYDSILSLSYKNKDKDNYAHYFYRLGNEDFKGTRIEVPLKDLAYQITAKKNTEYAWQQYIEFVNEEDLRDAQKRINALEYDKWGTENLAWATAQKEHSAYSYKQYMDKYPKGKHFAQAKRKYINLSVDNDLSREHGQLPQMEQSTYGGGRTSHINVYNGTEYTLTIFYSGPDCEELIIPSNSSKSLNLQNGSYRISARVSASNVRPYAGTETLSGGHYSASYYISQGYY